MKRYTFTLEETQEIKAARKKNRDKNVEKRLAALEMRAEGKQNKEINKLHIPENIELFYIETVQPNSKPTIPASLPIKKRHSFKGWYTVKTGGKLYNTVTSITASTTFYAQFEANRYVVTWNLGTGQSETTEQTYGEKLLLPKDPERKNAEFLGWFTEATGGTQVGCLSLAGETGFSLIGEADSRTERLTCGWLCGG